MKIKELIIELKKFPQNREILLSSDEELNTLFRDVRVAGLIANQKDFVVLWGNSGSEVD